MLNIGCVEGKQRGRELQECKGRLEVVFGRFEIETPKLPMQGGGGDGVQESGLKTQIRLDPFPPKQQSFISELHSRQIFSIFLLWF